jgi:hypothetical protein
VSADRDGCALPRGLERAWIAACLALAAWTCLPGLADVFLIGDELHSLRSIGLGWGELLGTYDDNGSGLLLPALQKALAGVLGHGPVVYRLPAILGALGTLLFVVPVARRAVGPTAALLALAAVATSPIAVFYARYGRGYSLAACLALAYVLALARLLEDGRRGRIAAVALAGGLLPAAHLSAASISLGVGLAALVLARARGRLRPVAVALGCGALLAALLHAPAWSDLRAFLTDKALAGSPQPFGAVDVAALLTGGRVAGWFVLIGLPAAALALLRRDAARVALPVAAIVGALAGLLLGRPAGLSFAYARYLYPAWPLALALMAGGLVLAARRLPLGVVRAERAALAAGIALLILAWATGPQGPSASPRGPFANSNLALCELPAFDEPWPRASAIHDILAGAEPDARVVVVPALRSRGLLLYRNHWLRHRRTLVLGHVGDPVLGRMDARAYVDLSDLGVLEGLDADFLVVHHAIDAELANYWTFVDEDAWPLHRTAGDEPLMAAHYDWGARTGHGRGVPGLLRRLRERLGTPALEDAWVTVWQL